MAALLNETSLNPDQQHYLDTILYSGKTLVQVINDILDISKLQAGKVELESEPFSLMQVLSAIEDIFDYQARQRSIELTVDLDPRISHYLVGDSTRLNQILFNLVGNAIKFTQDGYVAIRVLPVTAITTEQETIRIEVEDTGIGIAPEFHDQIFGAFAQAEGDTTRRFGGTGLGLMITRSLVRLMGGEVSFTSTPGEGSNFWLTASFQKATDEHIEELQQQRMVSEDAGSHRSSYRAEVLVVEDNSVNQMLAEKVLGLFGCGVVTADNGEEALQQLLGDWDRFDLILMDCEMPVMDGYRATEEIRLLEKEQKRDPIPIVALSAHAMGGIEKKTAAAGMDDYISKPFTIDDIAKVLKRWLPVELEGAAIEQPVVVVPPLNPVSDSTATQSTEFDTSGLLNGVIDTQAIERLRAVDEDGDDQFLHKILDSFLHNQPMYLDQLRQSIQRQEYDQICKVAHTMKSACTTVGAVELAQCCSTLENNYLEREEVEELFIQIRRLSIQVSQVLYTTYVDV